MTIPTPPTDAPDHDWRTPLGEVPLLTASGYTTTTHPLSRAFLLPEFKERAHEVLVGVVRAAEGRMHYVAAILGCHYHTAFKLVHGAELDDLAAELRYQNSHAGPTRMGIQTRRKNGRRVAAK